MPDGRLKSRERTVHSGRGALTPSHDALDQFTRYALTSRRLHQGVPDCHRSPASMSVPQLPIETVIKYMQSLNGRDKFNRLMAYGAKCVHCCRCAVVVGWRGVQNSPGTAELPCAGLSRPMAIVWVMEGRSWWRVTRATHRPVARHHQAPEQLQQASRSGPEVCVASERALLPRVRSTRSRAQACVSARRSSTSRS
jgi:hypothetical protein